MKTQNCGVLLVSSTRDLAWCPSNSVMGLSRWADHFILAVVFQVLLPCEFWGFSMECTGFSLVSFWFSPARSLLQLLVLLVSLLFPFCGCFHSYYSSSFCSISPLSPLFTSLFLVFPSDCLTAHTTFSFAHHFPTYLTVATLFSCSRVISLSVCLLAEECNLPGERRGPPEGASAPTGVEGACEDSALLPWSASNTDKSESDVLNWGPKVKTSFFYSIFCLSQWAPSRAFSLCSRCPPGGEHMTCSEKLQPCWQSLAAPFSPHHPASVLQTGHSVLHSEDKEAFSVLFHFRSKSRHNVRNKEIKVKREEQL